MKPTTPSANRQMPDKNQVTISEALEEQSVLKDLRESSIGCVIMASGLSKRFGENKLTANFRGKPLIQPILDHTLQLPFASTVVVTRQNAISSLSETQGIKAILHQLPYRNDTLRLGLTYVLDKQPKLQGCLFCVADQPLLKRETLETMLLAFSSQPDRIYRLGSLENPGNPILFPKKFFPELLQLPPRKGGGFLAKKYPEQVQFLPVQDQYELFDVDTKEALSHLSSCH